VVSAGRKEGGRKPSWRARVFVLALVSVGASACGTILGLGEPTLETDGGELGEAGRDATSGGGSVGRDGKAADGTLEASEASDDGSQADGPEDGSPNPGDGGGSDGDAFEAEACPAGQIVCTAGCVDPMTDPNNCQTCGTTCPQGQSCVGGSCVCPVAGQILCANGCVDPMTDPINCSTCGNTCVQGQSCVGGSCQCPSGESLCLPDGGAPEAGATDAGDAAVQAVAGYCANLDSDPANCNGCGTVCPAVNDVPGCVGGACTVGTCETGFADCDHVVTNGCEVYTNTDTANCGGCGMPCASGEICSNGTCVFTCPAGQTVCHGNGMTYCATLSSDPQNCGGCATNCANVCVGNAASFTCTASTCSVATCAAGYYDLNRICSDGCECHAISIGTCAAPIVESTLTPGQEISLNGNLVPAGADSYYLVTFTGNASSTYHPRVNLAGNPGDEYVFDVFDNTTACTAALTPLSCSSEGTLSTGLTDWEVWYGSQAVFPPGPNFAPIPPVGSGGSVLIHVYRATGAAVDCNPYTLVINN
jgi:hypothetical protein